MRSHQQRLQHLAHLQLLRPKIEFIRSAVDTKMDATFALVGSRAETPHFEEDNTHKYVFSATFLHMWNTHTRASMLRNVAHM